MQKVFKNSHQQKWLAKIIEEKGLKLDPKGDQGELTQKQILKEIERAHRVDFDKSKLDEVDQIYIEKIKNGPNELSDSTDEYERDMIHYA